MLNVLLILTPTLLTPTDWYIARRRRQDLVPSLLEDHSILRACQVSSTAAAHGLDLVCKFLYWLYLKSLR